MQNIDIGYKDVKHMSLNILHIQLNNPFSQLLRITIFKSCDQKFYDGSHPITNFLIFFFPLI